MNTEIIVALVIIKVGLVLVGVAMYIDLTRRTK